MVSLFLVSGPTVHAVVSKFEKSRTIGDISHADRFHSKRRTKMVELYYARVRPRPIVSLYNLLYGVKNFWWCGRLKMSVPTLLGINAGSISSDHQCSVWLTSATLQTLSTGGWDQDIIPLGVVWWSAPNSPLNHTLSSRDVVRSPGSTQIGGRPVNEFF